MGHGISRTLHSFDRRSWLSPKLVLSKLEGRCKHDIPSALFDALSPVLAMLTLAVDIFSRQEMTNPDAETVYHEERYSGVTSLLYELVLKYDF